MPDLHTENWNGESPRQVVPHGGHLVQRFLEPGPEELESLRRGPSLVIDERTVCDLEMLASGAYSPLEGFMDRETYLSVLHSMHLPGGLPWTLPITLPVAPEEAAALPSNATVALLDQQGTIRGMLTVSAIFPYDRELEARSVYGTTDPTHPGVHHLFSSKELYAAGTVHAIRSSFAASRQDLQAEPTEMRALFRQRGWRRVVGFQTRNPIHRAHEYIIKCAMEVVDGLFLNPLVGETKPGDIPAPVRLRCYRALLQRYFPAERAILGTLRTAMRYAGPREAVFHALIRKNFGCTHFIVGRDHAGVGKFYGTFDAQRIFDEFDAQALGITPLFFDNAFYCVRCAAYATTKTCPHAEEDRQSLSGTRVRELLAAGEAPPAELTRAEVADVLLAAFKAREL